MSDSERYALALKVMRAQMTGDWQAERDARDALHLLEQEGTTGD